MKRKKHGRLIGCMMAALAAILVFIGLFVFAVAGGFVDYRLEFYELWHADKAENMQWLEGWSNPMPALDTMSDAKEIWFQEYTGNFWGEKAYILIAKYDPDQYEGAKRILNETLEFETEVIDQGEGYPQIEPEFTMGRFHVRLLKTGDLPYAAEVPEDMYFAGTSDDACEILYIYHDDLNLDYIGRSFNEDLPRLIHWSSFDWQQTMPYLRNCFLPVY